MENRIELLPYNERVIINELYIDPPLLLEESIIWAIFIDICIGLNTLHRRRLAHRDIKPENIMLSSLGNCVTTNVTAPIESNLFELHEKKTLSYEENNGILYLEISYDTLLQIYKSIINPSINTSLSLEISQLRVLPCFYFRLDEVYSIYASTDNLSQERSSLSSLSSSSPSSPSKLGIISSLSSVVSPDNTIYIPFNNGGLTSHEIELRKKFLYRKKLVKNITTNNTNTITTTTQKIELCKLFYRAILSDFGACRAPRQSKSWSPQVTNTLEYCAPELLYSNLYGIESASDTDTNTSINSNFTQISEFTADVWALGITLFVMAFGHLPWQGDCTIDINTMLNALTSIPLTFPVYKISSR